MMYTLGRRHWQEACSLCCVEKQRGPLPLRTVYMLTSGVRPPLSASQIGACFVGERRHREKEG